MDPLTPGMYSGSFDGHTFVRVYQWRWHVWPGIEVVFVSNRGYGKTLEATGGKHIILGQMPISPPTGPARFNEDREENSVVPCEWDIERELGRAQVLGR